MTTPASSVPNTPSGKTCIRCGTDCSGKPRVKDLHGRYTCQSCVDTLKAREGGKAAAPAAAPTTARPDEPEGFDIFDLAPDPQAPKAGPCPNCGRPVNEQAAVCVACGYSKAHGRVLSESDIPKAADPPRGRRQTCKKCGYDIRGLKTAQCPECGTVNTRPSRRERDREDSARVARDSYLQPALMLLIGGIISTALYAAFATHRGGDPAAGAISYLISLAITVPIGVLVFWFCCLIWIGFDAPIHLTALRLAGIYAVTDVVRGLFLFVPLPWWAEGGVIGFIYIGLLQQFLEMDFEDALIVGLITFIVKVVTILVIASQLGLL